MQAAGSCLDPARSDAHKVALGCSVIVVSLVAITYAAQQMLGVRVALAPLLSAMFLVALFDAPLLLRLEDAAPVTELHLWSAVSVWLLCYAAEEMFCIAPPNFATWMVPAACLAWFGARLNGARGSNAPAGPLRTQARERYLIGLAGAAHELGTPLSTMNVLVGELRRAGKPPADWDRTVEVLWNQLQLCRRSLCELASAADIERPDKPRRIPAKYFVLDAASHFQALRPEVKLKFWYPGIDESSLINDDPTLSQALVTFLNNAADASPRSVELRAVQRGETLVLEVLDRGGGIAPQLRSRLGMEPASSKSRWRGVGMLIAHAALERYGRSIRILDRPLGGTCVQIELPLSRAGARRQEDLDDLDEPRIAA
jgi:signal transduction histidine kinase